MEQIVYLNKKEISKMDKSQLEFCSSCQHCDKNYCLIKKLEIRYLDKPINCFYYELEK